MRQVCSFSFAWGQEQEVENDGFVVFDCRDLPDPEGKGIGANGTDLRVRQWVIQNSDAAKSRLMDAADIVKDGGSVAFGCFAGKNRSVAMAEALTETIGHLGYEVGVHHRNLHEWV